MKSSDTLTIPVCKECGSKQIRTTKTHRICVRCGYKEELK